MRTTSLIQGVAAVFVGVGLLVLGATEARTQSGAPKAPNADLARGQRVFLQYCAMCHGDDGKGDGELAPALLQRAGVHVANLTDSTRIEGMGRSGIRNTVALGGAHTGRSNLMPAWGERLKNQELDDVVGYVAQLPYLEESAKSTTLHDYLQAPPGAPSAGREIFVHQCSACHGMEARGDGPLAASLISQRHVHPRNLTDSSYVATKTDRDLFAVISRGGGPMGKSNYMPHWAGYLTSAQIKDLVSYVRVVSRTQPRPLPGCPEDRVSSRGALSEEGRPPVAHSCLTMSTEISTAGTVLRFSSQWTVFRSSGQPGPGPYSLATPSRWSVIVPCRM